MWKRTGEVSRQGPHRIEKCLCRCGATGWVRIQRDGSLRTKSCRACSKTGRPPVHGGDGTGAYRSWTGMMARCFNRHEPAYADYGARGIEACRWWQNFISFREDMGQRPEGHSLDRIDGTRGYDCGECPDCKRRGATRNARWATPEQQANNTRRNIVVEHNGKSLSLSRWGRETGINSATLFGRYNRGDRGARLFRPSIALRSYPIAKKKRDSLKPLRKNASPQKGQRKN